MRLHTRFTWGFGVLLLVMALAVATLTVRVASRYHAEVTQRLNAGIAMYVTQELALLDREGVNRRALDELSRRAMTVNPSAEVYLLDPAGRILATLVPPERVKRSVVSLRPIARFLAGEAAPIFGDDPSSTSSSQVFSVSPVSHGDQLQGYLYVVLASEKYASIVAAVRDSYTTQIALASGAAILLCVAALSLALFRWLTLPLRRLAARMRAWSERFEERTETGPESGERDERDELAALAEQFTRLTARFEQQLADIAARDAQRRELIANVSHDLRTPLASLHGYLETVLLKGDPLPAAARREYLEVAHRHSQRLKCLVDSLFELSKLETGAIVLRVEEFSIGELLHDVCQRFRLRAQRLGIDLRVHLDRAQCVVAADLALVERVLENLIDNSLRHTASGGSIVLRAHASPNHIEVSVTDTGCGIDPAALTHVFDRLYREVKSESRTSSLSGGIGLGLAIVKRIVTLHGHTVSARSKPDQGTTIAFGLPLASGHREVATTNDRPQAASHAA
jgi:signal transduction histidine kinase